MGLFGGRGKTGGILNVIRCDEPEYLVWKWRPEGQAVNSTTRENSIRWGSSLRVKDGELAVFVYKQKDGTMQDFIIGPHDDTIKTANFPVLSSIVGLAFGGESPFQAEIYFINLSGNVQINFGIPFFDVADPRFMDVVAPISAGGTITFNITDYKSFIKLNRLINFDLDDFKKQVKDAVIRRVKGVVANAPSDFGFPLVQIERKIEEINDRIKEKLKVDFEEDFGVNLKRFDLSRLTPDKESEGWAQLRNMTVEQQQKTVNAQTNINIKNLTDTQSINARNMEETLRIQREEAQRAQRLQTETNFMGAHALNRQADVLQTAAENLGSMSQMGGGGGMNPAGMMAGMALGGAMGGQMAGMMNQMGGAMQGMYQQAAPGMPPAPGAQQALPQWMVAVNGQQVGPFTVAQLQQMASQGQFTAQTYVWRQGMASWDIAGNIAELAPLFAPVAPPMPGTPPVPGGVPPMPPTV